MMPRQDASCRVDHEPQAGTRAGGGLNNENRVPLKGSFKGYYKGSHKVLMENPGEVSFTICASRVEPWSLCNTATAERKIIINF